ncbi:MAG: hydrogenase maturation protease [Thermoguttaceae bacterium]|nr:hydrogenase maturation protease [Thermoguttaceae bacterium]MDW8080175.1 hydrogenase maturation protease [Thermoguttaceae bacterium]
MKVLILGLGNPLLTDDQVGLLVSREVARRLQSDPAWSRPIHEQSLDRGVLSFERSVGRALVLVEVDEECCGGLRLMERMVGYDFVVLIDAIYPATLPGKVHRLGIHDLPTQRTAGTHDAQLATALQVGKLAGYSLPNDQDIVVVGIEAQEVLTFGEECTPAVAEAVPQAADLVVDILGQVLASLGGAS